MVKYKRRSVEKAIVMALRELGGSASRKVIRRTMAEKGYDGLNYEQVTTLKKVKMACILHFSLILILV